MLLLFRISITIVILAIFYVFAEVIMHPAWRMVIITMKQSCMSKLIVLESVVRRSDIAIYWIVIFSTFVKLAVDQYNFIFRFGIHKVLRSIVFFFHLQMNSSGRHTRVLVIKGRHSVQNTYKRIILIMLQFSTKEHSLEFFTEEENRK